MRKWVCLLVVALASFACAPKDQPKRYAMRGEVRALDPTSKSATINAGKIGDWMEAMTMQYPVKPDSDFEKLHVGDHIQATVVVNDLKYYVTGITVEPNK